MGLTEIKNIIIIFKTSVYSYINVSILELTLGKAVNELDVIL